MKKKIWIMNHYATNMYLNEGGRHYWFAENLIKQGYEPTIFCANTRHNSNDVIELDGNLYSTDNKDNIPFVFVKTPEYKGNGKSRILNMVSFYKNLFPIAKKYAKEDGVPDVILASSVHPLTLVAGIKIAKKFGIPCICEVRDLWPESIVEYGSLKRNSIIAKVLYQGEKWIYKKADKIIFTMEGGKDYLTDRGWDVHSGGSIDLNKVYHVNNGVNLDSFIEQRNKFTFLDKDLDDEDFFKVIYAGSIRKVNDIDYLIDVAKEIDQAGMSNVKLLIYGDGNDKSRLVEKCEKENITNVIFKGKVPKHQIPFILSKSDLNIIHFQENSIKKYGASLNKLFEYFASGKPVLSDCEFGYDIINRYKCGSVVNNGTPKEVAQEIIEIMNIGKIEYNLMCDRSFQAAQDYDFKVLTEKFIDIIECSKG